jgi:ArsR family transcriptional regulator
LIHVSTRICALPHKSGMDADSLTMLIQVLADPTRRSALVLLRGGDELCVCELMRWLGATQSRMSRHMAALKEAGLVTDRRDAQWVRYRIASDIEPATMCILDAVLAATSPPATRRPLDSKPARSRRSREKVEL